MFEYGYDFLVGNELSGGPNKTESFKAKIKKEMQANLEDEEEETL